ncbi:MAG: CBS domain-containing protein [Ferruginibacter sp.]|nr:CBS domain-containing protein [Cytophagales bacterium]
MKTVAHLLKHKGNDIYSVSPDATVRQALEKLVEKNVAGLLVMENNQLVGIFTERDYARKVVLKGKNSQDTLIREIMTEKVITITPLTPIDTCMEIMTQRRIRHLPVLHNEAVVGVISIGDLVKFIIEEQKHTIQNLESYIATGG